MLWTSDCKCNLVGTFAHSSIFLSRYMGTITGISDLDPVRWSNSHWRSVKVSWEHLVMWKPITMKFWYYNLLRFCSKFDPVINYVKCCAAGTFFYYAGWMGWIYRRGEAAKSLLVGDWTINNISNVSITISPEIEATMAIRTTLFSWYDLNTYMRL